MKEDPLNIAPAGTEPLDGGSSEKAKRKQHYVPVFHLKGFTSSGQDDALLWVLDLEDGGQRRAKARSAGYESFLYRVQVEGFSPNFFEDWLAREVEGPAARIFKTIHAQERLPTGDDYERLMIYIAIQAVRIPSFRNSLSEFMDEVGKLTMSILLETPERWAAEVEKIRASGNPLPAPPEYEEVKRVFEGDPPKITITNEHFIANILSASKVLANLLAARTWTLWIADKRTDGFICSDRPVAIHSLLSLPAHVGPGFGRPWTVVTLPLSRQMALEGRFEGESRVTAAGRETVAVINGCTARSSTRYVFSEDSEFAWSHPGRIRIQGKSDLIAGIRKRSS